MPKTEEVTAPVEEFDEIITAEFPGRVGFRLPVAEFPGRVGFRLPVAEV